MTEHHLLEADYRRSHWPGWIWSVPIAAIGVAIWLGVQSLTSGGPTVVVVFPQVADIKVAQIPVARIGQNVAEATQGAAQVMQSRDLHDTLRHVEHTSLHLDHATAEVQRSVPRLLNQLRHSVASAEEALNSAETMLSSNGNVSNPEAAGLPETLYEVSRAARSLRELSSFLDQHPQALLAGYHGGN